jgi:hypothetical protein
VVPGLINAAAASAGMIFARNALELIRLSWSMLFLSPRTILYRRFIAPS